MFVYCGNNPVANVDSSGFAYIPTLERMIDGGSGGASVAGGGLALLYPFIWMIDTASNVVDTFDDWVDEQKNALSEAQSYARVISGPNEKYHAHHIVAKKDYRADPARKTLESVGIDPYTHGLNLVSVPQSKHLFLHTTKYFTYINSRFAGLEGNLNAVVWTLADLQVEIHLYCHTGLKAW